MLNDHCNVSQLAALELDFWLTSVPSRPGQTVLAHKLDDDDGSKIHDDNIFASLNPLNTLHVLAHNVIMMLGKKYIILAV